MILWLALGGIWAIWNLSAIITQVNNRKLKTIHQPENRVNYVNNHPAQDIT